MTRGQSTAFRFFAVLLFGAGFFLLRFFWRVVFKDANYGEPGFSGIWVSHLAAVPAGVLGLIALVIACVFVIKSLGKVDE